MGYAEKKRSRGGVVNRGAMVSGAMLMEVKTVLQTQKPVIKPVWNTFASSVSRIWKGVGALFSLNSTTNLPSILRPKKTNKRLPGLSQKIYVGEDEEWRR